MSSVKKVKARKLHKDNKNDKVVSKLNDNVVKIDSVRKKVKPRKIRMSLSVSEEKKLDNEIAREDNFSVGLIVCILSFCFIVGIILGYLLYKIAINGAI